MYSIDVAPNPYIDWDVNKSSIQDSNSSTDLDDVLDSSIPQEIKQYAINRTSRSAIDPSINIPPDAYKLLTPDFKRIWTKLDHGVCRKVLDIIRSSPQPQQVEAQVTIVHAYLVETYPEDISTLQVYSYSSSSHHCNNYGPTDPFTIQVHNAST